jgi:hypothetical protein
VFATHWLPLALSLSLSFRVCAHASSFFLRIFPLSRALTGLRYSRISRHTLRAFKMNYLALLVSSDIGDEMRYVRAAICLYYICPRAGTKRSDAIGTF